MKDLPKDLEPYAWNVPVLNDWTKAYIALEALETASSNRWKQVPEGWFNLSFAARHGRKGTKRLIALILEQNGKPWPKYPESGPKKAKAKRRVRKAKR
jgi:hypothetical protein